MKSTINLQEFVDIAEAGEETNPKLSIYWDSQDPNNEGPAYRVRLSEEREETGPLEFAGWSGTDEQVLGYTLHEYFDAQGQYRGPDQHGVYPLFWASGLILL